MKHSVRRWPMRVRTLILIACTIGLAGPMPAISGEPAAAEFTFDRYEVVLGSAERQTVLTGFFLGGGIAELAVVNIDERLDGFGQLAEEIG